MPLVSNLLPQRLFNSDTHCQVVSYIYIWREMIASLVADGVHQICLNENGVYFDKLWATQNRAMVELWRLSKILCRHWRCGPSHAVDGLDRPTRAEQVHVTVGWEVVSLMDSITHNTLLTIIDPRDTRPKLLLFQPRQRISCLLPAVTPLPFLSHQQVLQ